MIRFFFHRFRSLLGDRRGNVALITAFCAIPMFALLGFAIDYGTALSNKTKLDAAMDAAVMTAITTAKNIANAQSGSMTSPTNALTAGQAAGLQAFKANTGTLAFVSTTPTPTITVTNPSSQVITATVTYSSVSMNTNFSKIIGIKTIPLNGTSTASLKIGTYLDFYLLLDVSGSMGLPTTSAGQTALQAVNPDETSDYPGGCMFACHFSGYQGFAVTREYNIPLRADSVENAVCSLLTTAIATETLTNQFRVGIYPFIQYIEAFYPRSTNLTGAINAVTGGTSGTCPTTLTSSGLVGLLDQGLDVSTQYPMGSGGTHFENVITTQRSSSGIGKYITTIGTGATSASPMPFVFLVTDGMDNSQTYTTEGNFTGSNPLAMFSQTACNALKAQGVTISILYIPYVDIPANSKAISWAIAEDSQADAQIPLLPAALTSCATTGFFYTANSAADITNALNAMFTQALQVARITQ
ncbi:MAG: TadE/TadG family type IV pilus assembly protein [Beijerinckiaceae bacterium]|jgi:Flp pilus assembly protein TadG